MVIGTQVYSGADGQFNGDEGRDHRSTIMLLTEPLQNSPEDLPIILVLNHKTSVIFLSWISFTAGCLFMSWLPILIGSAAISVAESYSICDDEFGW